MDSDIMNECCICGNYSVFRTVDGFEFCKKHEKYKTIPKNDLNILSILQITNRSVCEIEERLDYIIQTAGQPAPRYAIDLYIVSQGWSKLYSPRFHDLDEAIENAKNENESIGGPDEHSYFTVIDLFTNKIVWNPYTDEVEAHE